MNPIDDAIRVHYQAQALSPERLAEIQARARRKRRNARMPGWRGVAMVAAAVLLILPWLYLQQGPHDLTGQVFAEIAMNHGKRLGLEVVSSDYTTIQSDLDRLDFMIVPPPGVAERFDLRGARYCSIQGVLAVQLRLRQHDTGAFHTLYVAPLTPELATIGRQRGEVNGVTISLSSGHGLFYGLAHTSGMPRPDG
jgi:hypothetical protein